jgi:hypothetical protein
MARVSSPANLAAIHVPSRAIDFRHPPPSPSPPVVLSPGSRVCSASNRPHLKLLQRPTAIVTARAARATVTATKVVAAAADAEGAAAPMAEIAKAAMLRAPREIRPAAAKGAVTTEAKAAAKVAAAVAIAAVAVGIAATAVPAEIAAARIPVPKASRAAARSDSR